MASTTAKPAAGTPRTEAEIIKEMTRLTARTVVPVMPGVAEAGPNGFMPPGTEGLPLLVDHAAEAYLRTHKRAITTPSALRLMGPQFSRLTNAIVKASQEGRFK